MNSARDKSRSKTPNMNHSPHHSKLESPNQSPILERILERPKLERPSIEFSPNLENSRNNNQFDKSLDSFDFSELNESERRLQKSKIYLYSSYENKHSNKKSATLEFQKSFINHSGSRNNSSLKQKDSFNSFSSNIVFLTVDKPRTSSEMSY